MRIARGPPLAIRGTPQPSGLELSGALAQRQGGDDIPQAEKSPRDKALSGGFEAAVLPPCLQVNK